MRLYDELIDLHVQMREWRQHLHQFPETAYQEIHTSEFIKQLLSGFGLEVTDGLAVTGIVATLKNGQSDKKIALRADMDALYIEEQNALPYKSMNPGKMHACGHDGHCAMLLGAAKYLSEHRNFNGTVYFIFQPAEEGRAGAKKMIDEGLFNFFPADEVYGLHNFPDIPSGHFAVKSGPMMASYDCFEIRVHGDATHAAMPHQGNDVVLAAAHSISALQSIVSRNIDPSDSAVVSITQLQGGNTWNAIPDTVVLRGTFRCFKASVRDLIRQKIIQIIQTTAQCFSVTAETVFNPENQAYPVTVNTEFETEQSRLAASEIAGEDNVELNPVASLGAEDFAFMLQEKPGCYIWLGNGTSEGGCLLHNPHYDFNDEILPVGASYWVKLVEKRLAG